MQRLPSHCRLLKGQAFILAPIASVSGVTAHLVNDAHFHCLDRDLHSEKMLGQMPPNALFFSILNAPRKQPPQQPATCCNNHFLMCGNALTGGVLMPSTQAPSQGAGQTRPVNSGKLLVSSSRCRASCHRPLCTRSFHSGILLPRGQPGITHSPVQPAPPTAHTTAQPCARTLEQAGLRRTNSQNAGLQVRVHNHLTYGPATCTLKQQARPALRKKKSLSLRSACAMHSDMEPRGAEQYMVCECMPKCPLTRVCLMAEGCATVHAARCLRMHQVCMLWRAQVVAHLPPVTESNINIPVWVGLPTKPTSDSMQVQQGDEHPSRSSGHQKLLISGSKPFPDRQLKAGHSISMWLVLREFLILSRARTQTACLLKLAV